VDTTGVPEVVISYALPEPPSATITTPADGAYYAQGATVSADYSCAEGANGPGLLAGGAGCAGPVASGTALDTSATGQYCFTVTATSQDGLTGSQTNCYTVIQQVPTSLTSPTGLLPFQHGGTAKLSSTLTNADTGNPIEGKDVTMTLGSGADAQSCDGVTDPAGTASCTIDPVTVALGPQPITDSFAGDGADLASTNAEHGLVYGGINGGSFVIGDGSATGTVTFWGSQWSKVNHLSGGPAPAGFKGFENSSANIACGAGWTAGPGNSARPPQGPLPAYMAVIMTSKVGKAGALISGDALNVVVIQTAGGYASDPGHAGTGTVVARIC
jgi:hypothetical protein